MVDRPSSDIIERLSEKRKKNHEDALKQLEAELTELTEVCTHSVHTHSTPEVVLPEVVHAGSTPEVVHADGVHLYYRFCTDLFDVVLSDV